MKKIVSFILLLFVSTCIVAGAIPTEERAALIALYNATDGDNWKYNSGWKTPPLHTDGFAMPGTEDTWYGIHVYSDQVTEIILGSKKLNGRIPSELGNLSRLEYLSLFNNQLSGSIPAKLGNLNNLKYLHLNSNQLSNSIPPELGNLVNLRSLSLDYNQLSGSIPPELGNLNSSQSLYLNENQLSGSIPPELGNLANLKYLYLNNNQLSGSIPSELGNLSELFELYLDYNQLSGSIPSELGNLSQLFELYLDHNQLSGSIPPELGNLNDLLYLQLDHNRLSGSIPAELGNLVNLRYLSLDHNQLSGSIPPELENLNGLGTLYLNHNQLTGGIPPELGNLNLSGLSLGNNQLSGNIPPELGNLINLGWLYLGDNQLSGSIPPELGKLNQVYEFNLDNNRLTGNIPPELANLSGVAYLRLGNNRLSGNIPPELENLSALFYLGLNNNQLSGSIPPELGNCSSLNYLYLNGNQLTGSIPSGLANLTNLSSPGTDIGYNGLYTNDETLQTFLNSKDPDWQDTQTMAPTNVSAVPLTPYSASVSWLPIAYTGGTGGYEVYSGTTSGGPWTYLGITADKSVTSYTVTGLISPAIYYFVIKTRTNAHSNNSNTVISEHSEEALLSTPVHWPAIILNRNSLSFGYLMGGTAAGSQTFSINSDYGLLNWTASAHVSWLNVSPTSGTGSGQVMVSIDPVGLSAGTYIGTITVSDPNASNSPQTVGVDLTVYEPGAASEPFGEFSTPINGSTVRSSIPVTGWALDDIGVENVKIYREQDGNLVYIGDAVLVEGARPDVEQAYPDYPMNYKAGWGYMMLTHFLPNGGNGTFKLHAIVSDTDGNTVDLGTKTITCDNANAVKPFGAIDTPAQGGTVSSSDYRNQGWVLTPLPNTIPTTGSTINVYIDGVYIGHPNYNFYRSDIAELFPGYANSSGAHAYFDFDTTAYENGVHTIYWTATDDAGNTDGIGSRYFTIRNSQGARSREQGAGSVERGAASMGQGAGSREKRVACLEPVGMIRGYRKDVEPQKVYPNDSGVINIEINQLERLEIHLSAGFVPEAAGVLAPPSIWTAFHVVGDQFKSLPIGSTLDIEKGIFYWQAGSAFIGEYLFAFVVKGPNGTLIRKDTKVTIHPKYHWQGEKE